MWGGVDEGCEPDLSKEQLRRLTGMERAGRQRNKIDGWVRTPSRVEEIGVAAGEREAMKVIEKVTDRPSACDKRRPRMMSDDCGKAEGETEDENPRAKKRTLASCPICDMPMFVELVNDHIDVNHPP